MLYHVVSHDVPQHPRPMKRLTGCRVHILNQKKTLSTA